MIANGKLYIQCWRCVGGNDKCPTCRGKGTVPLMTERYEDLIEPRLETIVSQLVQEVISLHERIERLEASTPDSQ